MNYPGRSHSQVFVQVTSAVDDAGLKDLQDLRLLNYTDSASLGATQQVNFTLSGRARRENGTLRPTREVLQIGDLIRTSGFHWTEQPGSGRVYGLCDGLVTDVTMQEQLQDGGYQFLTHVNVENLQHVLMVDAVAWWMYYGDAVGVLRTRGELMPDDVSGHLDRTLRNYLDKIALSYTTWTRDNIGLKKRLGLDLRSLPGNTPVARSLTVAEGSHWGIISEHADLPLHELFMQMRAPNDAERPNTGRITEPPTHKPATVTSTPGTPQDDGAQPYIVLRPAPFPYADESGKGMLDEWQALPLHDLGDVRRDANQRSASRSIQSVRNFFMVFPSVDLVDERMAFTVGLAVKNEDSIRRYSYRPVKFRTRLILKDGDEKAFLALAKRLTWRIAGQMNRMEQMLNMSLQVPLAPAVQPGDRVRFRLIGTDATPANEYEGYVTARTHTWNPQVGGQTTLSLERVLPASTYANAAWFVQGLEGVEQEWSIPKSD